MAAGRCAGGRAARCRGHARTCRSSCASAQADRGIHSTRCGRSESVACPWRSARSTRTVRRPRGAEHLSQEPRTGDLRHGRRRRTHRESRLRDPPDEPGARARATARGLRLEILNTRQPFDSATIRDEVGRRVAHHVRGVPRPGPRVRGGAGPDLHPRRRLVPVVLDADDDHAGDPVLAGRASCRPTPRSAPSSRRRR